MGNWCIYVNPLIISSLSVQLMQPKALPIAPSGRYERETAQDATLRRLGAEKLGLTSSSGPSRQPGPTKRTAPDQSGESAQKKARPSEDRNKERRPAAIAVRAPTPSKQVVRQGRPIIMVPPGLTSIINMYNIGLLLEKGMFKTVEQCRVRGCWGSRLRDERG